MTRLCSKCVADEKGTVFHRESARVEMAHVVVHKPNPRMRPMCEGEYLVSCYAI